MKYNTQKKGKMGMKLGLFYYLPVFSLGFVLGALRSVLVGGGLNETYALIAELPVMLSFSWLVWGKIQKKLKPTLSAAMKAGIWGFIFLMASEILLGLMFMSLDEVLRRMFSYPGILGLIAQMIFGLIPWLRIKMNLR